MGRVGCLWQLLCCYVSQWPAAKKPVDIYLVTSFTMDTSSPNPLVPVTKSDRYQHFEISKMLLHVVWNNLQMKSGVAS